MTRESLLRACAMLMTSLGLALPVTAAPQAPGKASVTAKQNHSPRKVIQGSGVAKGNDPKGSVAAKVTVAGKPTSTGPLPVKVTEIAGTWYSGSNTASVSDSKEGSMASASGGLTMNPLVDANKKLVGVEKTWDIQINCQRNKKAAQGTAEVKDPIEFEQTASLFLDLDLGDTLELEARGCGSYALVAMQASTTAPGLEDLYALHVRVDGASTPSASILSIAFQSAPPLGLDDAAVKAGLSNAFSFDPATGTYTLTGPYKLFSVSVPIPTGFEEFVYEDAMQFEAYVPATAEVFCDSNPNQNGDIEISSESIADDPVLLATNVSGGLFGYFLSSDGQGMVQDPPGSLGDLCLSGSAIGRYTADMQAILGGSFSTNLIHGNTGGGVGNLPTPPGGQLSVGETWYFQGWVRVPGSARWTKALRVTFCK